MVMMLAEDLPLGDAAYPCKIGEGICGRVSGEG
jgi:hypothetical protein